MHKPTTIFFLFLLITSVPYSYAASSATAQVYADGTVGFTNDQIVLDNDSTLDLSFAVETVPETIELIGGQNVTLSQEVIIDSSGEFVTLKNTELTSVEVEIPKQTKVSAPANWNQEIAPPKSVSTVAIEVSGFQTPTSAIEIGSPFVVLFFDRAVTIILENTNSTTAYKLPGATEWNIISQCSGTYDNPNLPPANGECSITDGVDTKIRTFHFTQFTGLTTPAPSTPAPETSTGKSGGHGNTGVGSPRIFGGSSGSSGGGTYYGSSGTVKQSVFPTWFDNVTDWYREGKISALEFLNAYQWVTENVMR